MIVRTTVKSIQDIMRQDVGVDGDAQRISQLTWMFFLKIIDDQDQELELTKDGYRSPIPKKFQWRNWAADPEGITGQALLDFINDELFPALKGLPLSAKPGDRRRVVRDVFEDVPIASELCGPFFVYLMLSSYFWNEIQQNLRGIAYKGLNLGILRDFPIPLPPLAEQHRIVAKVDAVMVLCERLEANLTASAATRRRLLDALLAEALAPAEDRELEAAE
jgi:hypothetical protein